MGPNSCFNIFSSNYIKFWNQQLTLAEKKVTIVKGEIPKDLLKAAQWADWGVNVRYKHMNIFCACGPFFNNKIVFVFFLKHLHLNSGHNICFKLRNKK